MMTEENRERALAELAEQRGKYPDLASLFDFQTELLRIQLAAFFFLQKTLSSDSIMSIRS